MIEKTYTGPILRDPEMETLEGEALETIQFQKLKSLLTRVYEKSTFYREQFDAAGVNPKNFSSLSDYSSYPLFTKDLERES